MHKIFVRGRRGSGCVSTCPHTRRGTTAHYSAREEPRARGAAVTGAPRARAQVQPAARTDKVHSSARAAMPIEAPEEELLADPPKVETATEVAEPPKAAARKVSVKRPGGRK